MEAIFGVLAGSSVRATIIALAVAGVLWALRVKSPAIRHRAWTSVLAAMLLLPVLSSWGPKIAVPLLPPVPAVTLQKPAGPAQEWKTPSQPEELARASPALAASVRTPVASQRATAGAGRPAPQLGIYGIAVLLYLAGFLVLMTRLFVGMLLSYRLVRVAGRGDRSGSSPRCAVPLTVGLLRPSILLPEGSKDWDPDRLDAVLAHEREHVRRRDPLVEWLALMNRGIYWFHPLAWWLCRKLVALAEQACDDAVLARGHDPDKYAELLLELARCVKRRGVLVMAWGSSLDGSTLAVRIRRIVTAGRSPALSRIRVALVAALCAGAILVPATCELLRAQAAMSTPSAIRSVIPGTPQVELFDFPNPFDLVAVRDLQYAGKDAGEASAAHHPIKTDVSRESPEKNQETGLKDVYKKWLNEDVVYIITTEEKAIFLALKTDDEREMFIAKFWERREQDPFAGDGRFKKEHYRRLAYANEHFGAGVPGWKTDRGRIYIVYGEPDRREFFEGGSERSIYPFERWYYRHIEGFGDDVTIEFIDKNLDGSYILKKIPIQGVAPQGSQAQSRNTPNPTPLSADRPPAEDKLAFRSVVIPADSAAAQMKIISIRMREIQAPDRNDKDIQKAQAEAAEAEIRKFLEMFPNSDYAPAARQYLEQITAQKTAEAAQGQEAPQVQTKIPYRDGTILITADKMESTKTRYHASGNVRIVIQDILITCDAAEYDDATHIGKTSGRTKIIQGQSQAIGFRCEFDLNQQPPRLLIMK